MTGNKTDSHSQAEFDAARLQALQIMLCARIDELFAALGILMYQTGKKWSGPCPVHGGDSPQACQLYPEGDSVPGYWRCYTRQCEHTFKRTILGFIRGVLSHQRGWSGPTDKQVPFGEVIKWSCAFLGKKFHELVVDTQELEKRRFAGSIARLTPFGVSPTKGLSREVIRRWLERPAEYFVKRGWSEEILDKYDVGRYPAEGKPLSDRVVVPIFDAKGRTVIGMTGRSLLPQCEACRRWHQGHCPSVENEGYARSAKWYNHEFNRDSILYNWWFAQPHIQSMGVACLVEGPGDLWRLEEAGIPCGLGMLGASLSEAQQVLLEMSGAMTLVVLTNEDEAGRSAAADLKTRLGRLFRIVRPALPAKDLGEMAVEEVRKLISPLLERSSRR